MNHIIHLVGNRQVKLTPQEKPAQCAPGYLMGPTLYSLISPGTELSGFAIEQAQPKEIGYASILRIEAIGEGVSNYEIGDLVFCLGRHQSYQHVEAQQTVKIPDGLDPTVAVVARLLNVSMTTLITTTARPGELVLVTGGGPVGLLAAKLFQFYGYEVMLCDPDAHRLSMAEAAGIKLRFAQPPIDDPAWEKKAALVLECSGHEAAVLAACQMVRPRGEVVLIGTPWRRYTESYAQELTSLIFHRYAVVRSGWEWELPMQVGHFQPNSIMTNLHKGISLLNNGFLDGLSGFTRIVSAAQANEVFNDIFDKKYPELFIILDWADVHHA